jgi:multidrug resistance efflux pump
MKSVIGELVRSPGYRPSLRAELRFYREGKDIVTIHDPVRDRRYQLYENECVIAREMNGQRDLDDLTRIARNHLSWATRDHVERLATQIAGMGLLANVPSLMLARPSTPALPTTALEHEIPRDYSNGLDDWTDMSDGPFDDAAVVAAPAQAPSPPPEAPPPAPIAEPLPAPPPPPPPEPAPAPVARADAPAPNNAAWEVERPSFFARHRRLVYLGGVVLVLLLLAIIPYPLYITEPCTVRPVHRAEVRSQIEGVIVELLVKEGDLVEAGAPLARLEDRDIVFAMQQAKANIERLSAALAKVRTGNRPEEIRRAKALVQTRAQDVRFANIEAARVGRLFRQGVASAAQRDEAAKVLTLKRSELEQAQAELKLIESGFRSEEVTIAQAELLHAQAEVEFLNKRKELLTIRAPIAGRVLTPRFHERLHARVAAGDTVCELGSVGDMLVEIHVDEAEADAIEIGQPVEVKVRSFPLEVFEGHVDFIAPAVVDESGRRILRVDARVDNAAGLLQPRMTGYAEIDAGNQTILGRVARRALRWVRVRFLI